MARRKTARIDLRTTDGQRKTWQREADRRELPLSVWVERVCDAEVERVERSRLLREMYPNRPDVWEGPENVA
jgi:hypothetical protein